MRGEKNKQTCFESGLLELEETTFHKRFEADQSKAAAGLHSLLPAVCKWSSVHEEGIKTCGNCDTYLSCMWLIHLACCICWVSDLSFFSSLLKFPLLLRHFPCRWGIGVSCRWLRMGFLKFWKFHCLIIDLHKLHLPHVAAGGQHLAGG